MELSFLTISEAKTLLSRREISAGELCAACLRQIECLTPTLNAFITVFRPACPPARTSGRYGGPGQGARLRTERSRSPQRQSKGELAGIPIVVKDMFEVEGILTTGGSKIFSDYVPRQDAHVISKLKAAGAAIIGKTNMHEIALGVTGANLHYGACRNPWDVTRITGGSSSGSAAAVAAGMCLGALGTDTGGSIRIPAALCGVVGMKPTYGRVSLRGVIPLSWNLDHAGPMARTVRDVALLLQVIAGYDPLDPACVNLPVDNYLETIDQGVQGWRVALADGEYSADSDVEVLAAVEDAAKVFEQSGAVVTKADVSFLGEASLANGLMVQADAAAYHRQRLAEHPDWFGEDVRQRLQTGAAYSSTEYALARRTQVEMRRKLEHFFADYDILLTPTTSIPAPPVEGTDAVEQARRLTRFTAPFNLTGLPALSLPCGFTSGGLPIGLQIIGRAWGEARVLQAGHSYEQATEWHTRHPVLCVAPTR